MSPRVLGVDPGSRRTGWAVVTREAGRFVAVASGVIQTDTEAPMARRLASIFRGLGEVLMAFGPDAAAVEAIFSHRSAQSALVLGQARGVALAALAGHGLEVHEYNASTIKLSVTGSGKAQKEQVGLMVERLLGATLVGPADVRDAAAIAMTHHLHANRVAALASLPKVKRLNPRSPAAWGLR